MTISICISRSFPEERLHPPPLPLHALMAVGDPLGEEHQNEHMGILMVTSSA